MGTAPKSKGGRPEGQQYPHIKSLRFSELDRGRLARLSEKLELPLTMVVRRAIRDLAEKEGVE